MGPGVTLVIVESSDPVENIPEIMATTELYISRQFVANNLHWVQLGGEPPPFEHVIVEDVDNVDLTPWDFLLEGSTCVTPNVTTLTAEEKASRIEADSWGYPINA